MAINFSGNGAQTKACRTYNRGEGSKAWAAVSSTTSSNSKTDCGVSCTVTPSAAASRFQVNVYMPYRVQHSTSWSRMAALQLFFNHSGISETQIIWGERDGHGVYQVGSEGGTTRGIYALCMVHHPNTTNEVTYSMKQTSVNGSTIVTTAVSNDTVRSRISVIELD